MPPRTRRAAEVCGNGLNQNGSGSRINAHRPRRDKAAPILGGFTINRDIAPACGDRVSL